VRNPRFPTLRIPHSAFDYLQKLGSTVDREGERSSPNPQTPAIAAVHMETSLHRQLKELYADGGAQVEAPLGRYRIDVVCDGELIEIQHGSLAAIRDKVRHLLKKHRVLVVKPIVHRKQLIKQDAKGGRVVSRRRSPKAGAAIDLFEELVYFTRVFPHRNLSLEVPLVDIEEWRYPGHGRRRRHRKNDHQVEDQKLTKLHRVYQFQAAADLWRLIPGKLPSPFDTGHLAKAAGVHRWIAQRIAYCLRKTGAAREVGKKGNTLLYEVPTSR
jgi:hypothetical protein